MLLRIAHRLQLAAAQVPVETSRRNAPRSQVHALPHVLARLARRVAATGASGLRGHGLVTQVEEVEGGEREEDDETGDGVAAEDRVRA